MRLNQTATLIAATLLAAPTFAGHDHGCEKPVQECLNLTVEKLRNTGFIGVELDESAQANGNWVVSAVVPGSPAQSAGIQVGDQLDALNGIPFGKKNWEAMRKVKTPGREVTCTITRNGASRKIKLTLAPMPADMMAKYLGEHMMYHAKKGAIKTAKK